jgi:hypothetical protein
MRTGETGHLRTGRCPGPRILFLLAQEKYAKEGRPAKISPSGPVCSVGCAEFWELAPLRQPKILNAPPWSQP